MQEGARLRATRALRRVRRFERREVGELRDWLENTRNLLHLSILVLLPLLFAIVTYLSNTIDLLPFLLFPPLASGAHTLFAHPGSRYASPRRFVGGLTTGALCGWAALELTARFWYRVPPEAFDVHPGAAALALFLTGAVTWGLDIEESSAFSAALLVLVTGATRPVYVLSVAVSTGVIAAVFVLWRRHFYEQRAHYLYRSTKGDDHVLVPMRGPHADATAMLAARLAGAHDAGKVVLLDVVEDRVVADLERALLGSESEEHLAADGGEPTGGDPSGTGGPAGPSDREDGGGRDGERHRDEGGDREGDGVREGDGERDGQAEPAMDEDTAHEVAERRLGDEAVSDMERRADRIEASVGVPCEVIVAADGSDLAGTVLEAARGASCDLIVAPYEAERSRPSPFVRGLLASDIDVVLHRSEDGREQWRSVLVPVRRAGDVAHAMIDFALRLADRGRVSVCHSIGSERERRSAEEMLANLVETVAGGVETRVAREGIGDYLGRTAGGYDLVVVGASTDRSAASRLLSPPTFRGLTEVDTDVAIVHRG